MTQEELKYLSDRELQEQEHDTQVDFLKDLTGNKFLIKKLESLNIEMKLRGLDPLPRLNAYL